MYLTSTIVFKPGGFTGSAGTPNFLQSLDAYSINTTWTDSQIGGLQSATLRCKIAYENVMDIQAGNWVAFGCYGGTTGSLSSGATSIVVPNCTDDLGNHHIIAGDSIMVAGGNNAEVFKAASVSYSGSTATITLGAAVSQSTTSLLNSYTSASVTKLQWQGMITGRKRSTELSNIFEILISGMMWRYTKVIGDFDLAAQDCAYTIYRVATMYSTQVPEVIVSSGNFVATNNIIYSSTAQNATIASIFSDILKTESGGAVPTTPNEATYWAVWVDELRQLHHAQVPTQNSFSPTMTLDLKNPNPYGDALGPVQPQDMDMSRMLNCVLVAGGTDTNGNVIDIVLTVKPSYQQWGYYEGFLSNPNITDKGSLATWAAGQVGVLAWPQQTGKLSLVVASTRMTSRDLLEITGFDDSSTLYTNPTQIQYTADNKTAMVTASADITQQQPNFTSIMKEIANGVASRNSNNANQTQVTGAYIVSGCALSTSGLTWSTTAGTVFFNGTLYSIPAANGTMTANDTIKLGVQVAGTAPSGYTLPCVCPMPNFTGVVRMSAHEWYELQNGTGYMNLVQQTNFQGLYLATMTANASTITQQNRTAAYGGIGQNNLMPLSPASQFPAISAHSVSLYAEGAASVMAVLSITLTGVFLDATVQSLDVSWSLAGTNQWHPPVQAVRAPGSLTFTAYIHGLAAGQSYDLGVQVRGQNEVAYPATPVLVGTSPSISASAISIAINNTQLAQMPAAIKTNGPTITSSSLSAQTRRGGIVQTRSLTFTESDFITTIPAWIDNIIVTVRINGDTAGQRQLFIDPRSSTSGTYTQPILATLGDTIDVGVSYEDVSGQVSAVVWAQTNQADIDGPYMDSGNPGKPLHVRMSQATQGAVDSSSRVVGNLYDGTTAAPPANVIRGSVTGTYNIVPDSDLRWFTMWTAVTAVQ